MSEVVPNETASAPRKQIAAKPKPPQHPTPETLEWEEVPVKRRAPSKVPVVLALMFGLVADETLYLKTDDATRAEFETAGSTPFVFESKSKGKTVTTSYWSVPAEAMDAPDAMRPWAQRALDAAHRKAVAKPKRKR